MSNRFDEIDLDTVAGSFTATTIRSEVQEAVAHTDAHFDGHYDGHIDGHADGVLELQG